MIDKYPRSDAFAMLTAAQQDLYLGAVALIAEHILDDCIGQNYCDGYRQGMIHMAGAILNVEDETIAADAQQLVNNAEERRVKRIEIEDQIAAIRVEMGQNSQLEPGGEERAYRLIQRETALYEQLEALK